MITEQPQYQITLQHELENPKTDVIEAIVWLHKEPMGITDIVERCLSGDYTKQAVHLAINKLVQHGRLSPQIVKNPRKMGPKNVTYYKSNVKKPRLFV